MHSKRELLTTLEAEQATLSLPGFSTDDSWWLGCRIRNLAVERGLSVAVEIRRASTVLFACVTGSACSDQFEWIRRKIAVAMRFERSSYAVAVRCDLNPAMFQRSGLNFHDHVDAGGAVPIVIAGTGVVGVIAVSGLPKADDHALATEALVALKQRQVG